MKLMSLTCQCTSSGGDGPAKIIIVLNAHARVPVPELALQHLTLL